MSADHSLALQVEMHKDRIKGTQREYICIFGFIQLFGTTTTGEPIREREKRPFYIKCLFVCV